MPDDRQWQKPVSAFEFLKIDDNVHVQLVQIFLSNHTDVTVTLTIQVWSIYSCENSYTVWENCTDVRVVAALGKAALLIC
jgi:hypothetical protein